MGEKETLNPQQYVKQLLDNNKVVIFSKTWCPYCYKAKDLFKDLDVAYHDVMLDNMGDRGCKIQEYLEEVTHQKTVPNIFINATHLGGYTTLYQAQQTGRLEDILAGNIVEYEYDVIIIGGGSGGLAAAQEAAALGKKVAVCDFVKPSPLGTTWGIGGTCVNVGCIPKKLMHRASLIGHDIKDASFYGWTNIKSEPHDWNTMVQNVQDHIKSINWMYTKDLKKQGIAYYNNFAQLINKHTVKLIEKGQEITGETIIIATGGRPSYGDIPGANEFAISSDDLFTLKEAPKNTLVIGGGYIALESAGFLHELGNECTVMVRSILLRGFDQQMAGKIEEQMTETGIKFLKQCIPTMITKQGGTGEGATEIKVEAINEDGTPFTGIFNTVLLAIGRTPCTEGIGIESVGVKLHSNTGKIIVNELNRTNVPNIFAVGDVTYGRPELTPVAIQAGKQLVRRLYTFSTTYPIYRFIPTTVFTPLEYGCVGDSEERAIETYGQDNIEVFHSTFSPVESKLSNRFDWRCYAKIVCLKEENKMLVIGLHVLAPNAGEITQGFALALKLGATKDDFDQLFAIHPTNAQIFTKFEISKSSGKDAEVSRCCS